MVDRQRVQWVEIDIPHCTLTWGNAPCTSALSALNPRKCRQTYSTCGAKAAFAPGVRTLVLTPNVTGLPLGVWPLLDGLLSESEATINIGGADPDKSPFGRGATIEVRCTDCLSDDAWFDKYQTERKSGAAMFDGIGYDPVNAATFFRKLKAWWPHYAGRPLRSVDGWLENGVLIADITRHYIITEFETDTAGKAVFKGRDILDLAGNEKRKRALCPKPNTGRLKSAINATSTTLTLSPAGVGSEYAISGRAVIGQEIVSFTRAGDVLTLTGRGLANTGADGHAANATVQQTAYWWKARPHVVLRELMVDYAGIPSSQINLTEWADESFLGAPMLRISTEITTPKEVSKLVAEMSVMGLSIWPDVEKNKIGYKTSRPIYDDATWEITDDDIAKGDVKMDSRDDKRLTAVFFQTVQINPLKDLGEDNFLAAHAIADGNAISANAYGDIKHVVQRIRWMNHGADFVARLLAKRYLNRFLTAPQQSKVTLRRDQFGGIGLADVVYITSRSMVDDDGRPKRLAYQVIGRSTAGSGLIDVTFQRYLYEARYGRIVANGSPDYSAATIEQKARGSYIVGPSLTFPDNTGPYVFS